MPGYTTSTIAVDASSTLLDVSGDGNIATFRTTGVGDQQIFAVEVATGRRIDVATYTGPFTTGVSPDTVVYGLTGGQVSADGRYVLYGLGEIVGNPQFLLTPSQLLIKDLFTGATRTVLNDTDPGVVLVPVDIDGAGASIVFLDSENFTITIVVRDLATGGEQVFGASAFTDTPLPIALSADGQSLAYRLFGQPTILRDLETNGSAQLGGSPQPESLSADGRFALVGGAGNIGLTRVDTVTGETLVVTPDRFFGSFALSDSGRYASYLTFNSLSQPLAVLKDLETGQTVTFPGTSVTKAFPTNNGTLVLQRGTELVELNFASPTMTLDTIAGDDRVNGAEKASPIVVSGNSDQLGGLVEVFSNGVRLATARVADDGTWTTTIDVSLAPDGTRTLSARVENFGKAGSDFTSLLIDSQAAVSIGGIGNGDDIVNASESVIFYGESDAPGGSITLLLDGAPLGQAIALPNGVWQFGGTIPALADGTYTVQASVVDAAGNAATTTRSFSIDRTPPTIAITQLGDSGTFGAAGSSTVAGTSDAIGRSVALLIDGVQVGQATVQANGTWQAALPVDNQAGPITVTASVSDAAGNVTTDTEAAFADLRVLRVSEGSNGEQGAPVFIPGVNFTVVDFPSFDAAGNQVAFSAFFYSLGPDPEPDDFVGPYLGKTYVKNLATGELVPVAAGAPDGSLLATLSPDGGHVAFATRARLLPSDTNGGPFDSTDVTDGIDIYLKDLATGALTLVSAAPNLVATGDSATTFLYVGVVDPRASIAVSDGGRVVAWLRETDITGANGLVNQATELVVRDVVAGTSRVLVPSDEAVPSLAERIALSRDGDVVAWSATVNYSARFSGGPSAPPVYADVYGGNWRTGTITSLSTNADGTPIDTGLARDGFFYPIVSADGTKVAFQSRASLWVKDITTGALSQAVSWDPNAGGPNFTAFLPDGRILFNSAADIAGVVDGPGIDLFAVDPATGAVTLVAAGTNAALTIGASADGRLLAVLTPEALERADTNGEIDLYVTPTAPTTVSITAAGGTAAALSVSGTASAIGATVSLFVDGASAGSALVAADGSWGTTLGGIGAGAHQLRATVTDALGFSSSDGATVTLGAGGTVTGLVFDGYVAGATVFADADGDGVLDPGEVSTVTDGAGGFTLAAGGAPLGTTGGVDIATGLAQPFTWQAPAGFGNVTALSTLIAVAQAQSAAPLAAVLANFVALLPAPALLQSGDVLAAARAGDATAQAQLLAITAIATQLAVGAAALSAVEGTPPEAAFAALVAEVADAINGRAAPPDLAALGALIADAVAALVPPDGDAAIGDVLDALFTNLLAALPTPGGDPISFLAGLSAVARVGQADLAAELAERLAADAPLAPVLAAFNDAALAALVADADLGDLDGPGIDNAPTARPDAYTMARGRVAVIDAAAGLGANDRDADDDALIFSLRAGPAAEHGRVVVNADGGFSFVPMTGFMGETGFTYTATDAGGLSSIGTVTLTIEERAETLSGSTEDDRILGYGLDDVIAGLEGSDRLLGGDGADTLIGGEDNDVLDGTAGRDWMEGGTGNDVYFVDPLGDIIIEEEGGGIDRIISTVSISVLQPNVEQVRLVGSADIDAEGNELDNLLHGNAGQNLLLGDRGNDRLDGGAGVDSMIGGAGNDVYVVDDVREVLVEDEGGGTDRVVALVDWTLGDHFEQLTLAGTADISGIGNALGNVITGNVGANSIFGGAGRDRLNGGRGADTLLGGADDDVMVVDDSADVVVEEPGGGIDRVVSTVDWALGDHVEQLVLTGTGNVSGTGNALDNLMLGNDGANRLDGGGGDDRVNGLAGDDALLGGGGKDLLNGGLGADTLTGGAEADIFDFRSVLEANGDVVTDFTAAQGDRLRLSAIDANAMIDGNQAFAWIGAAAFSGAAGQLRFAGGLLQGDVDGDSAADFTIALEGVTSLSRGSVWV